MVIVDPGFNRLIWNHYNPQNEKYGIRDMYQTMKYPRAIAADGDGYIYVTDVYDYKIVKYRVDVSGDGHRLQYVASFGEIGSGNAQFVDPFHIEITKNNSGVTRVYVSDLSRQDIQMFDSAGNFILKIGEVGSGDGQFNTPRGMAAQGNVLYVADTGNNRIQKLNVSDAGYVFVSALSKGGELPADILFTDVALGNGGLYIVDERNNQIHLVSQDFDYLKSYQGNPGDPFNELRDITFVPNSSGFGSLSQAVTVEKKRIQSFRLGMEAINLSAEPAYFHPLALENNTTKLKYTLTENGFVKLHVKDANSNTVRTLLVDQPKGLGRHEEVWDGRDNNGNICPGGWYQFELIAFDNNANGHAIKWDYKYFPVQIHEAPIVTIQSVAPSVIAIGTSAVVNYTLSKPGSVQMEVLDQNSTVVQTVTSTGVEGNNTIA
ncbi:hypothetical protein K8S19_11930 [bacterium]|nr:hypothetical protein [bacterium]